ncbi:MAG: 2-oxoacid:ferredoxin oxidoreductase subunit beta, partial [Staphylococcus equorum]
SPCVTYNKVNTYDWFKENLTSIDDIEGFDVTDKSKATQKVLEYDSLIKGIVYQDTETPSYESQIEEMEDTPLAERDIHIDETQFNELTKQFV